MTEPIEVKFTNGTISAETSRQLADGIADAMSRKIDRTAEFYMGVHLGCLAVERLLNTVCGDDGPFAGSIKVGKPFCELILDGVKVE